MGDCHIHGDVKYAEDNGFSHAWLYDSQMLGSEVYASMALCADRTSKIKIGPGVTNPASRIAPLSACGMATINSLAPGRAVMGIGTGNTTRRTMGMPAAKVAELEEHVRICRDLFDNKITDYYGGRYGIEKLNSSTQTIITSTLKTIFQSILQPVGPRSHKWLDV